MLPSINEECEEEISNYTHYTEKIPCKLICLNVTTIIFYIILTILLINGYDVALYKQCHEVYHVMVYLNGMIFISFIYQWFIMLNIRYQWYDMIFYIWHKIVYLTLLIILFIFSIINSRYVDSQSDCALYIIKHYYLFYVYIFCFYTLLVTLSVIGFIASISRICHDVN